MLSLLGKAKAGLYRKLKPHVFKSSALSFAYYVFMNWSGFNALLAHLFLFKPNYDLPQYSLKAVSWRRNSLFILRSFVIKGNEYLGVIRLIVNQFDFVVLISDGVDCIVDQFIVNIFGGRVVVVDRKIVDDRSAAFIPDGIHRFVCVDSHLKKLLIVESIDSWRTDSPSEYILVRDRIFPAGFFMLNDNRGKDSVQPIIGIEKYGKKQCAFLPKMKADSAVDDCMISGLAVIRSTDIYPFEIAFESVLRLVDEFVLIVDKSDPPKASSISISRDVAINNFLRCLTGEMRKKVRVVDDIDFGFYQTSRQVPKAQWITDIVNVGIGLCKYENVLFVMADEVYDESCADEVRWFASQSQYDAWSPYFLHYIYDLNTIRNPDTVAYTTAVRCFKRDKYKCCWDGYSFNSLSFGGGCLYVSPKLIHHIGYVFHFKEKSEYQVGPNGIFDFDKDLCPFEGVDVIKSPYPLPSILGDPKFLFLFDRLKAEL